jgi:hypothetical protein
MESVYVCVLHVYMCLCMCLDFRSDEMARRCERLT